MEKLETEIAEAMCDLNKWTTPARLKGVQGRDLTPSEIRVAMGVLEAFVPYNQWIQVWRTQHDDSKSPEETPNE